MEEESRRGTMEQRRYSKELKREAIKLCVEQGYSLQAAADRLSIPRGTLSNWVAQWRYEARGVEAKPGGLSAGELETENRQLRKQLAEAKMERDIIKKALAYFAKEPRPSTRS